MRQPAAVAAPAPSDHLRTDSLSASMAMLLALTVVQRLVGFLRGILFCRWLDAEQLGQWDMAFGFLMLAAPLAVLGLPGSLGRYVEYYRQRAQLRTFLGRTLAITLVLTALTMGAVAAGRAWIGELVFGTAGSGDMVLLLAAVLGIVVFDNFFTSLYTALRQVRFVALTQFTNSLVFALLGVGLVLAWHRGSDAVVLAFCGACVVTVAVSLFRLARLWPTLASGGAALSHRSLWTKLAPFAFWLWLTNWLSNLSGIADRLMIVHWSGLSPDGALNMVGQYHTARIFPLLMIGVAELLTAVVTPHLSCDWEHGRREAVSQRLVLMLKGFGLALIAGAVLVLVAAPVLFDLVWQERFAEGLVVLPWALACAVWTALAVISNNYLWCAERSRYVCLTLAAALALNVGLSYLWLPSLGLLGAALAAAAARLVALAMLWWLTARLGMRVDRGLLAVAALPALLGLGPWIALAGLAVVGLGIVPGLPCFNSREREQLAREAAQVRAKAREFIERRKKVLELGA